MDRVKGGWQRQVLLLALALVTALWQLKRSNVLLSAVESEAERQLSTTISVLQSALGKDVQFFKGAKMVSGMKKESGPFPLHEVLLVVEHSAETSAPKIKAEVFVDPLQRRKQADSTRRRNLNQKKPLPLLGVKLYDSALKSHMESLKSLRLVEQILNLWPNENGNGKCEDL